MFIIQGKNKYVSILRRARCEHVINEKPFLKRRKEIKQQQKVHAQTLCKRRLLFKKNFARTTPYYNNV